MGYFKKRITMKNKKQIRRIPEEFLKKFPSNKQLGLTEAVRIVRKMYFETLKTAPKDPMTREAYTSSQIWLGCVHYHFPTEEEKKRFRRKHQEIKKAEMESQQTKEQSTGKKPARKKPVQLKLKL